MFDYNLPPPESILGTLTEMIKDRRKPFKRLGEIDNEPDVRGIVWVLVHAKRSGQPDDAEALRILDIHLSDHVSDTAGSRSYSQAPTSTLLAHALRA